MLARTLPLGPTVKRLCDSMEPSTSPSTSSSSRVRISPLMVIDAPMIAVELGPRGAAGTAVAAGGGAGSYLGGACMVPPSSFRLFHTSSSPPVGGLSKINAFQLPDAPNARHGDRTDQKHVRSRT